MNLKWTLFWKQNITSHGVKLSDNDGPPYTWYHNAKLPQAGDSLTIIFKLL